MRLLKLFMYLTVWYACLFSIYTMYTELKHQLVQQHLEGACINKYINMGIERKHIYPANGTCTVKYKKGQHRR